MSLFNNKLLKIQKSMLDTDVQAEFNKVAAKTDKTYVDTQVAAVASGSPKGVYTTLSALQTAYPTGTTGIYVVTADGKWYYWNGSAWTAGGLYQSTGIIDNSIEFTKLKYPLGHIVQSHALTLDYSALTITVNKQFYIMCDQTAFSCNVQPSVSVASVPDDFVGICYFDRADNKIKYNLLSDTLPTTLILLFYKKNNKIYFNNNAVDIVANGSIINNFNNTDIGIIPDDNVLNINTNTRVITCSKQTSLFANGTYNTIRTDYNYTYTETDKSYVKAFYYDISDMSLKVVEFSQFNKLQGNVVICYFVNNTIYLNERAITVNGVNIFDTKVKSLASLKGTIVDKNVLNIDTNARVITCSKQTTLLYNGSYYTIPSTLNLTYVETNKSYTKALYYDITSNLLKVVEFAEFYKVQGNVLICYFVNDSLFENEGSITINGINTFENYDWLTNRFLLPDEFYFVKGIDYSLVSTNFNYNKFSDTEKMQFELVTTSNVQKFRHSCVINSQYAIDFNTIMGGIYNQDLTTGLFKNLKFHFTDTAKTQNNKKVLMIGDSLTHMNLPSGVKQWLNRFGITATMIGTMEDNLNPYSVLPMEHGEGRQGWRLTDFTGVNTHDGARFPASTALNSQFTNPFLNPSTNVFDFSYYMSSQGYTGVDFVTIYGGTNDILNYSSLGSSPSYDIATVISNAKTALSTMVNSIKAYDPNIKIAIIPPTMIGLADYQNFRNLWAQFIEEELYYVKTSLTGVYTVGTFATSSVISGKRFVDVNGTDFSTINNTRKYPVTNEVHKYSSEVFMDGLWIASWIMNILI